MPDHRTIVIVETDQAHGDRIQVSSNYPPRDFVTISLEPAGKGDDFSAFVHCRPEHARLVARALMDCADDVEARRGGDDA
jgi:hypothetical protein